MIVGAGIAGLACARRLHAAGHPFLVISENVGGRICRSRDGRVNLGAYYVRADYHHVNGFMRLGRRIDALRTLRHDRDGGYAIWDRRLLLHVPQATRLLMRLRMFRRHYEALKTNCLVMSQAQAITSDPVLDELYRQPATAFIQEHHLVDIARAYLAPGLYGTAFVPLDQLNAFTLLLGALPVLIPIFEFTFRPGTLAGGFSHALITDTVVSVSPLAKGFQVATRAGGRFTADSIVVATPPHVSQTLLGLPAINGPARVHMFELRGDLRDPFDRADINLFSEGDPTFAIARQPDRSVLLCTREETPDLDRFLRTWEVVEHKYWNPAFHLRGSLLLECRRAPGLYLIGDHNICGLEDAYLSGLYAAGQVLAGAENCDHATAISTATVGARVA